MLKYTQHKCRYIAGNPSETSDEEEDAEHCPRIWKHLNDGSDCLKCHGCKDHRFSSKPEIKNKKIKICELWWTHWFNYHIYEWCCFIHLSAICPEKKDPKRTPNRKTVDVNGCFHCSLHTRLNWNIHAWTFTQLQLNQLKYFTHLFI